MKLYLSALLVLILGYSASPQTTQSNPPKLTESTTGGETCRLKLGESPVVRGLRLGMDKAEVKKEYPKMTFTLDPVTSSGVALSHQISNPRYQSDIDRITVTFRNDKVFSILFIYDGIIDWDSTKEFADKVSESLKLPKATMRRRDGGIVYYSVNCGEFVVRSRINNEKQPILFLTKDPDEMWESTEQKKDTFKP